MTKIELIKKMAGRGFAIGEMAIILQWSKRKTAAWCKRLKLRVSP